MLIAAPLDPCPSTVFELSATRVVGAKMYQLSPGGAHSVALKPVHMKITGDFYLLFYIVLFPAQV